MRDPEINPQQQAIADEWNRKHPAGTAVRYWPGPKCSNAPRQSFTTTAAWVIGTDLPVVMVNGIHSAIPLVHVEPLSDGESLKSA